MSIAMQTAMRTDMRKDMCAGVVQHHVCLDLSMDMCIDVFITAMCIGAVELRPVTWCCAMPAPYGALGLSIAYMGMALGLVHGLYSSGA